MELSLRHLGVERIDLFQLHRIDPKVPLAEQLGELVELQTEGKIRHIGLSEVTVAQIEAAARWPHRLGAEPLQPGRPQRGEGGRLLRDEQIGFIPWFPMATGALARPGGPLDAMAEDHAATPSQLALAWLLRRSPVMLPIPGTSTVTHLEENVAAATIDLTDDEFES